MRKTLSRSRLSDGTMDLLLLVLAAALLFLASCAPKLGDPVGGLSSAERRSFDAGRAIFASPFVPESGLGPAFNGEACATCHESPVQGGVGDEVEVHVGEKLPDGCDRFIGAGGPVVQQHTTPLLRSATGLDSEPRPLGATKVGLRTSPHVFGLGLVDAVEVDEIMTVADPNDLDGDGISGRPSITTSGRLGKFGRKAATADLDVFNVDALLEEQGITTNLHLNENMFGAEPLPAGTDPAADPELGLADVTALNAYVRFLAPPEPLHLSADAKLGREIFASIGCAKCHRPALRTSRSSEVSKALRDKEVSAYSDFLLHDMGRELEDVCAEMAMPNEFRTAPLMGLRLSLDVEGGTPRFLHDGRARTIEEAVMMHGGEAEAARNAFGRLSQANLAALVAFLKSL